MEVSTSILSCPHDAKHVLEWSALQFIHYIRHTVCNHLDMTCLVTHTPEINDAISCGVNEFSYS